MAAKKQSARKIRTILIPNRGEIALRIVRTARALGVRAVVAHSAADGSSLAVRAADDAVLLGPAAPSESYLAIDRIIEAARRVGADAVHPGYGFLSEREAFARAVEESGLAFIGPTPETVRQMGDKVSARATVAGAGVPVVPGRREPITDTAGVERTADEVGLPLLLKAAAGGGGKGIRLVRERGEIASAFRLARSEAQNAFGDPTLFAERYLERARHVEVQVLGDGAGGARVFPERDCSIQRRHQKLIEETPCPDLDPELREKLLAHALRAVQASKYRGAGTLEFLYDGEDGIYFLEMNTRLQVEHPITEAVTGVDLVAEQIAVAEGKRYRGKTLEKCLVAGEGAAVELRVNAEDPALDFAPSIGVVNDVRLPGGPGIRVDSGAHPGLEITPFYDSLVAKVIASGRDRDEALARLRVALEEITIRGVATTLPVGLALLDDAGFRAGRYHCQYLGERLEDPSFLRGAPGDDLAAAIAVAAAVSARLGGQRRPSVGRRTAGEEPADDTLSPWARLGRTHGLRGIGR